MDNFPRVGRPPPPKSAPGRWQRDRPVFSMVVSAKTHLGQRDVTDNARKGDRFTLAFPRCVLLAKTLDYTMAVSSLKLFGGSPRFRKVTLLLLLIWHKKKGTCSQKGHFFLRLPGGGGPLGTALYRSLANGYTKQTTPRPLLTSLYNISRNN